MTDISDAVDYNPHRPLNAAWKRAEQLQRWKESETNRESNVHRSFLKRRVKFPDGCVFLAACASGDTKEVEDLLKGGADINTTNVDGLTALHQAVIDGNLEMVQFLVNNGAAIDAVDNEGWTAVHAAVSCSYLEIAKFLVDAAADLTVLNSEGELPVDLIESDSECCDELHHLMDAALVRQNINVEAVRHREETLMLEDAQEWVRNRSVQERRHPRSGATALHVAAAKGYIKVVNILVQAGVDLNAKDKDGWTPLHAAAHWGERQAAEVLVENMADMDAQNDAGQTCFDVADPEMLPLLHELKRRQATLKQNQAPVEVFIEKNAPLPYRRKNSVNRMSTNVKQAVSKVDEVQEAVTLKSASSSEASDNEIEAEGSSESGEERAMDVVAVKEGIPSVPEPEKLKPEPISNLSFEQSEPAVNKTYMSGDFDVTATKVPKLDSNVLVNQNAPSLGGLPLSSATVGAGDSDVARALQTTKTTSNAQVPVSPTVTNASSPPTSPMRSEQQTVPTWRLTGRLSASVPAPPASPSASAPTLAVAAASEAEVLRPRQSSVDHTADLSSPLASENGRRLFTSAFQSSTTTAAAGPTVDRVSTRLSAINAGSHVGASRPPIAPRVAETPVLCKPVFATTARAGPSPMSPILSSASEIGGPVSAKIVTTGTLSTLSRSFQPVKRDDESESERKAHARRQRETRRSTQGVTLTDIRSAVEQAVPSAPTGTSAPQAGGSATQHDAACSDEPPSSPPPPVPHEVTYPWRRGQRSSSAAVVTNSANGVSVVTLNGVLPLAASRSGTVPANSIGKPPTIVPVHGHLDEDNNTLHKDKDADDKGGDRASQTARRRSRQQRRSTGPVSQADLDDVETDESLDNEDKPAVPVQSNGPAKNTAATPTSSTPTVPTPASTPLAADRRPWDNGLATLSGYRSRYPGLSSLDARSASSRASSIASVSSASSAPEVDYKKLYEEEKDKNEKLQKRIKEMEDRMAKPQMNGTLITTGIPVSEKETRALQRRLTDLEDELKQLEQLKADNQRLKEENGALIRVISKLSK